MSIAARAPAPPVPARWAAPRSDGRHACHSLVSARRPRSCRRRRRPPPPRVPPCLAGVGVRAAPRAAGGSPPLSAAPPSPPQPPPAPPPAPAPTPPPASLAPAASHVLLMII